MVKIGINTSSKAKTASSRAKPKLAGNGPGSGIKKAISTTKPDTGNEAETNKTNEELEKDLQEEGVESSAREETAIEKKEKLDKLLKRDLTKDSKDNKKSDKAKEKDNGKEIDKEWLDNTQAKEKDGKRTDILKDGDQLKDVLRNDKKSIAERYPGIERPGASSGASPKETPKPQENNGNSNGSNNNGGSDGGSSLNNGNGQNGGGISKLSDGGSGSSNSGHNHAPINDNSNGGNSTTRPNQGNGGGAIDFPRNNHDGGGSVQEPDHGHGDHQVAHTKFESLFTEGHLEGKTMQARSVEDAQRITATLKDVGAFNNVEQNGNSIKVSGFNAEKSHDVHEAYGKVLGREFLAGNIEKFSFDGVNENIAGQLSEMLESKAGEIGSQNHNIESNCNDGSCNVSVTQNQNEAQQQEQNIQEPQINQNEESNQTQIA